MSSLSSRIKLSFDQFWSMREKRERQLLLGCAGMIVAILYYLLLLAPAIEGRTRLRAALPALHQQVAQLQSLSNEVAELKGKAQSVATKMTFDTLALALTAHGLKAQNLNVSEQTAQLDLKDVSYTQTLALLDELSQQMHVEVVEARFTALEKSDMINASLTLHQAGMP